MDDDPAPRSNRARKRIVNEGVRRLLDTPGWNPWRRAPSTGDAATPARDALHAARVQQAEEAAAACPECQALRRTSGDPTDLCPRHLAEAIGP